MQERILEYVKNQINLDLNAYRTDFSKSWELKDQIIIEHRDMPHKDFRNLELLTLKRLHMEPVGVWGMVITFNSGGKKMKYPNENQVNQVRKNYPKGVRVKLINMDDPQAPPAGTLGTVRVVDDTGTIFVDWDTGSSLGVIYGEDQCVRI